MTVRCNSVLKQYGYPVIKDKSVSQNAKITKRILTSHMTSVACIFCRLMNGEYSITVIVKDWRLQPTWKVRGICCGMTLSSQCFVEYKSVWGWTGIR
jgi:hypothetical protein